MPYALALYHDRPIHHDAGFLHAALAAERASGDRLADALDTVSFFPLGSARKPRRRTFSLASAVRALESGDHFALGLFSGPRREPGRRAEWVVQCAPVDAAREESSEPWLYLLTLIVGEELITSAEVVELTHALADRLDPHAGVLTVQPTFEAAADYLHLCTYSEHLSEADRARLDAEPRERFGEVIRGPEWGTIVHAGLRSSVQLAGLDVRLLADGGALVMAGTEPRGCAAGLERVRTALAPVSGR